MRVRRYGVFGIESGSVGEGLRLARVRLGRTMGTTIPPSSERSVDTLML